MAEGFFREDTETSLHLLSRPASRVWGQMASHWTLESGTMTRLLFISAIFIPSLICLMTKDICELSTEYGSNYINNGKLSSGKLQPARWGSGKPGQLTSNVMV